MFGTSRYRAVVWIFRLGGNGALSSISLQIRFCLFFQFHMFWGYKRRKKSRWDCWQHSSQAQCLFHLFFSISQQLIWYSSGTVTGIIRFVGFFQTRFDQDPTWDAVQLIVVTDVEAGLYNIAASLLSFRPLLRWAVSRTVLSTMRSRSNKRGTDDGHSHILQEISYTVTSQHKGFRTIDEEEIHVQ